MTIFFKAMARLCGAASDSDKMIFTQALIFRNLSPPQSGVNLQGLLDRSLSLLKLLPVDKV